MKDFLGDETYRPVRNKKTYFLHQRHKIQEGKEQGLQIEKYAFNLFHMTEIEKLARDNRFLVGKLQKLQLYYFFYYIGT